MTAIVSASSAYADSLAGDLINNIALAKYSVGGVDTVTPSNQDSIIIAERLDVALIRLGSETVASASGAIPLLLTNRGNGHEAFDLSVTNDRAAGPGRFAIDVDGDGRYDASRDQLLTDARSPELAAGATQRLLLIDATSAATENSVITIVAKAVTGSGAPGTTFTGRGDGGGDAVVGPTGARAETSVETLGNASPPSLLKEQAVLAPDGSARPVRGAIVTYMLTANFTAAAVGARIDDPIPAGTAYVPGSLTLDAMPLTDAADADAGQADATTVGVALGDVPALAQRTLQFKVRIQ